MLQQYQYKCSILTIQYSVKWQYFSAVSSKYEKAEFMFFQQKMSLHLGKSKYFMI